MATEQINGVGSIAQASRFRGLLTGVSQSGSKDSSLDRLDPVRYNELQLQLLKATLRLAGLRVSFQHLPEISDLLRAF